MADEIKVVTGVSWLHDTIRTQLQQREQDIKGFMSRGVPYHEYIGFVGRHKECVRQQTELDELFAEFYKSEDVGDEADGLEELKDE